MGNLEGAIAYIITSPAVWGILAYNINHATTFKIRSSTLANAVSLLTGVKPNSASRAVGWYLNNESWLKGLGLSLVEHRTGGVHGNGIYIIQVVNRARALRANAIYARLLGLTARS